MACCSVDLTVSNLVLIGVLVLAAKKLFKLFQNWRLEQMLAKFGSLPKDKVFMHSVWRAKTIPTLSPFALKLETYLRMAKIPYELETTEPLGPKGKFPWITYNGTHLADSHLIIQFLNKKFSVDLNQKLSEEKKAVARTCRVMLEDHWFWGLVHYRFIENSSTLSQIVKIPTLFKFLMPLKVWSVRKRMEAQGIGKHTPTEIYQMTEDDIRTASEILGKEKYFGGEEPCEEDCSMFGMLAQCVWGLPGSSYERLVNGELKNLRDYCERMRQLCWPDWENCLDRS